MDVTEKPFSKVYVVNTTAKHIRKSIDISIEKTVARVAEFADNQEKSLEVLMTLSLLHAMQRTVNNFCAINMKDN